MGTEFIVKSDLISQTWGRWITRAHVSTVPREQQFLQVTRRYEHDPVALQELVDVLHALILDVPTLEQ